MKTARLMGATAAILTVLALAACTGNGNADLNPTPTAAATDVVDITDQPGSVDGWVGALEDAHVATCARQGDEWIAAGTVTNPVEDAQSYRLYVSLLDGSETRGLVQVDVPDVAAGASGQWKAAFPLTGDDFTCVLRVERFAP